MIIQKLINEYKKDLPSKDIYLFLLFLLIHSISVGINIKTFSLFLSNNYIDFLKLTKMISIPFIGGIISIPFTQYISLKFKIIYSMFFGVVLRAIGIFLLGVGQLHSLWYIGLFLSGIGSSMIFTGINYIISYTNSEERISRYGICVVIFVFAAGVCLGNIFIHVSQIKIDNLLFIISGVISLLSLFMLSMAKNVYFKIRIHKIDFDKVIGLCRIPVITIMYLSYVFISLIYFVDQYIYAKHLNHKEFLSILNIVSGILLFALPMSYVNIKHNNNSFLIYIIILLNVIIFFVTFSFHHQILFLITILFFLLGVCFVSIFIISTKILKSVLLNQTLIYISNIVIFLYNLGSFCAVIVTGNMIDSMGGNGLIYSIFLMSFIYLIFVYYSLYYKKN